MTDVPLGLYVHWPYCARICPYCDFNVFKNRDIDSAAWARAFERDLEYWAARSHGRPLVSLYFGGGTPSLAPVAVIERVIDYASARWGFAEGAEITLEANPTDTEQSRFTDLAKAGVNRLSLGVQSLRNGALNFLGRDHTAQDALLALEAAQKIFQRTTFDLIYARPGQTITDWRTELGEALALGASHLSLYQLTIEQGTAFARAVDAGRWRPSGEDISADMFELTQAMTAQAGLPAYEISNHAAPNAKSRHNLIYWQNGDYIGIGPGAHGRLTGDNGRIATETVKKPGDYLAPDDARAAHTQSSLTGAEAMTERFAMGLRLIDGMALAPDDEFFAQPDAAQKIHELTQDGLLQWNSAQLVATPGGRQVLNRLLYVLLG